jgi:predicted Zn-dependent protease
MDSHLRSIACGAVGIAFSAIACSGGDTSDKSTGDSPNAPIERSIDAFRAISSYRIGFEDETSGDEASIKTRGEAVYQGAQTIFSRMQIVVDPPIEQVVNELLFLPPDVYLHTTDDAWYVQSPWNQGIKPSEMPEYSLDDPIIDYPAVARELSSVERMDDEISESGEQLLVFAGERDLNLSGDTEGKVSAEIRLHADTYLPAVVRTRTQIADVEASITRDVSSRFLAYDEAVAAPPAPGSVRPWRDFQFPHAVCTGERFAACLEPQNAIQPTGACSGTTRRICFVPLGQISPQLVQHLVDLYRSEYGLTVEVLTPSAVPDDLANPLRNQIDASTMIAYMGSLFPDVYADRNAVLIGLTPLDLYDSTSHFRYLFGIKGDPSDPRAVVSSFRMDPQFYDQPADEALYFSRYRKLLTKYVGLLYYGLPTSSDPNSPMYDHILSAEDLDHMEEPLRVEAGR